MKNLIILFISLLLSFNCYSQDSIDNYLSNSKKDFRLQERIMSDNVVDNYEIIFIGETHGFKDNYEIAYRFIKEYKEATDFTYLLAEMDWATSQKLNTFLLAEDTTKLKKLINKSKSSPSWCKERYEFYEKIIELNKNNENKILYLGADIPAGGITNTAQRLVTIINKYGDKDSIPCSLINKTTPTKKDVEYIGQLYVNAKNKNFNAEDLFEYKYHLNNIKNYYTAIHTSSNVEWDKVRDSCIFENYKKLEKLLQLQNHKMIGIWGHTHTLQEESNGVKWFASNLKNKLNKKVYSYRIFYFDSKCMIPEQWLPGVLKICKSKKRLYHNTKLQNDDSWVTGTKLEVKKLKKVTPKNSISYYDLTKSHSPFSTKPYLVINRDLGWKTTDYFQTAIVVRNSLPTEPFGENRK